MLNHKRIVNLTIFPPQKTSIPCRWPQLILGDVSVEFLSVVERDRLCHSSGLCSFPEAML